MTIKAVKCVKFTYKPTPGVLRLLETFRYMCNDAVRIALVEKPRSRFDLIKRAYQRLGEYSLHAHYIPSACEVAQASYANSKRESDRYIRERSSSSTTNRIASSVFS